MKLPTLPTVLQCVSIALLLAVLSMQFVSMKLDAMRYIEIKAAVSVLQKLFPFREGGEW